jgi:hypothetical protein
MEGGRQFDYWYSFIRKWFSDFEEHIRLYGGVCILSALISEAAVTSASAARNGMYPFPIEA